MATAMRSSGQATRPLRPPGSAGRPAPATPRRRLSWVLAGIVLVVGFALAFTVIALRGSEGQQALVLARPVAMGQVITEADLRTSEISGEGLALVPASDLADVVGSTAAVPLVEGMILTADAVGAPLGLRDDQALVALALPAGRYPPQLAAGDHVRVVATPSAPLGQATQGAAARTFGAVVASVEVPTTASDTSVVVTLQVADQAANGLAQLGAAGEASIVLVSAGGS